MTSKVNEIYRAESPMYCRRRRADVRFHGYELRCEIQNDKTPITQNIVTVAVI